MPKDFKSQLIEEYLRRQIEEEELELERQASIQDISRRTLEIEQEHPFFAKEIPSTIIETGLRTAKKPLDIAETPGAALRGYLASAFKAEGPLEALKGAGREGGRMLLHGEERGLGELAEMAGLPKEGFGRTMGELGIAAFTDPLIIGSPLARAGGALGKFLARKITSKDMLDKYPAEVVSKLIDQKRIPPIESPQIFDDPLVKPLQKVAPKPTIKKKPKLAQDKVIDLTEEIVTPQSLKPLKKKAPTTKKLAGEETIFRQGRKEGNWWSPDKEYVYGFGKKDKPIQTKTLSRGTKLIDESNLIKQMTKKEKANNLYDEALERLEYDGFIRLEDTMEGTQYKSYYLKTTKPTKKLAKIEPRLEKAKLKGKPSLAKPLSDNPSWSKVHGMIGKKESGILNTLGKVKEVGWQEFDKKILDRFASIRKASQRTYEAARRFPSHRDLAEIKFRKLDDIFTPVRKQEDLITDYVDAHRALTRARRGLKNPNNVTVDDATKAIKEMEDHYRNVLGENPQVLKNVLNNFQKWTHDYILKEAVESGLLSKARYKDIVKNNEWYATFDVLDYMPDDLHKIGTLSFKEYFSVDNQAVIKRMVGTEKKIADPIEATIRKFAQSQSIYARNRVAGEFVTDPNVSKLLRPVAMNKKEFAIMKNKKLNPIMSDQWNPKEFDTINHFSDGRINRYITSKEIADSMKQLTPFQAPRVIGALNNIFRKAATTWNPAFTVSNTVRDALMAYTSSSVYKTKDVLGKFQKDWMKGFWEGLKHEFGGKSDIVKQYIKHGGGFGFTGSEIRQAKMAKKQLFGAKIKLKDVIKSPLTLIEKINSVIELAPRIGIFERAKILNHGLDDAALLAKQGTIDFNRGGTWSKVVNQFVPFLNARIQGVVTVGGAFKRDPKGTLSKIFVSTVIPGMAAYAWNRLYHSNSYDDIPEYVKENYFTIITGTKLDEHGRAIPQYITIPKGDVGQMAFNPLEFGMDRMWKKDKKGTVAFLINYLSDLSPVDFAREGKLSGTKLGGGLLPPIAKGFIEDWANLKFYQGREIVPYWMGKAKPPELQHKKWTPDLYKWLGKKLKISPLRIQNFSSNIFAGYGREGLSPDSMWRGLSGRIIRAQGGEIQNKAFIVIKDIEKGYTNTRAFADELVKDGNPRKAIDLMLQWNDGLEKQINEFNKEFSKYEIKDKGGLSKSYRFSPFKRKALIKKKLKTGPPLERRLTIKSKNRLKSKLKKRFINRLKKKRLVGMK